MVGNSGSQDANFGRVDAKVPHTIRGQIEGGGLREDLVREFNERPIGPHSGDLQQVLNILRGGPLAGKFVLICLRPHQEWVLARLPGRRGAPLEVLEDQRFTSIGDAERAVFKLRWRALTGQLPR